MQRWRTLLLAGVAALVLAGCRAATSTATGEATAPPATNPRQRSSASAPPADGSGCGAVVRPRAPIFFVSERTGYPQPYALRGAAPPQRLTSSHQRAFVADLGADASRLLLVESEQIGSSHREWLAALELDASRSPPSHTLGPTARHLRNPHSSPDGRSVVFEADLNSFRDIYRLWIASGRVERLTHSERGSFEPRLSPDGQHLVFTSSRDGNAELYLLNLRSHALQRLTWSPEDDAHPRWSPDGRRLTFVRTRRGRARVFTMEANGAHPRPLRPVSRVNGSERDAVFSPDGRFIALVDQLPGRASVRVVRARDGAEVGHSEGEHVDQQPAWSPDGRYLVFVSNRTGNDELFLMARDSSCLEQLTHAAAADWLPRWARPEGSA